jgi:hypothetical protein
MASIVTSQLQASGLPKEVGYTAGFGVMTAMLILAALAGLLIPVMRRQDGEPEQAPGSAAPVTASPGAAD